jgi:hypothetical protein
MFAVDTRAAAAGDVEERILFLAKKKGEKWHR